MGRWAWGRGGRVAPPSGTSSCTVLPMRWMPFGEWWSNADFGSVPEWVAALGTSAAFLVAAWAYLMDARRRREAQARLVYAEVRHVSYVGRGEEFPVLAHGERMGLPGVGAEGLPTGRKDEDGHSLFVALAPQCIHGVAIVNASDEIVDQVTVRHYFINEKDMLPVDGIAGTAKPRSDRLVEYYLPNPPHPAQRVYRMDLLFRDSRGHWWLRDHENRLERIHEDPESMPPGPHARPRTSEVSRRVRWNRFVRRLRRKRPIP